MSRRTHRPNWRLTVLIIALALGTVGVVVRLAQVQIADHDEYAARADDEHLHKTLVRASRGAILDRNGFPLATTVNSFDVYVDPRSWEDDQAALEGAAALAPLLQRDPAELIVAARAAEGDYLAARGVTATIGLRLLSEPPPGVRLVDTSSRFYPEGDLASALLGFLGRDQYGLAGIEADYDIELGGGVAEVYFERDGLGNPIPFGRRIGNDPKPGNDVQLTIDRYIQQLVEQTLDAEVKRHQASGGTILVMDPNTGEILAMASRPSFQLSKLDFNDPGQADLYRNRAVTDVYSPGSVLKTITMAAAVDAGLVAPGSTYEDDGSAEIEGDFVIHNWDLSAHGTTTATDILKYSLNTGAVWVSNLLGATRFYEYLKAFGFGESTHSGMGGEAEGIVRTNKEDGWYPVDLATNSFGQGISATPVQVVSAVASLVNGGLLMRPYVVKEVSGPSEHRTYEPVVARRVITEETSRTLVQMMNAVVDGSPGHLAQVPGYHVGGKTGTTTFEDNPYSIASFVGFAPLEDPKFIMLVKIDEPKDDPLGGRVAAPVFGALAPKILTYLGARPDAALVASAP
jgi:cell division protein FtsI/penicillin-binding protein 2